MTLSASEWADSVSIIPIESKLVTAYPVERIHGADSPQGGAGGMAQAVAGV